jgi:hypothetical protein
MKSLEIKVPAAPESTTVVVLMIFRQVLEISVIGTWNMKYLSFTDSLYKSYCYIGKY